MQLLDVRADHLEWVKKILAEHVPDAEVWAFGSRAKWLAKDTSDLDLCVDAKQALSFVQIGLLKEAFEDSDLPYKVDIVDWATTSASFRKIIEQDKVVVQQPATKGARGWGMSSEWQPRVFGDLVEIVSEKAKAGLANFENYISTENMEPNFGGVKTASTIPPSGSVTRFKVGDTLFSNIRTYFKKVWQADIDGYCSNDVLVFRSKDERTLHSNYLHNLCRWERFIEFSVRTSKGAKMPRGDKDALIQFEFQLANIDEQSAISEILRSLDDRITLLRETNATLEAIAQALFKSWFVDFDPVRAKMEGRTPAGMDEATAALFPDSFEETELGLVPKGWRVGTLADLMQLHKGSVNPSLQPDTEFQHFSLPAFDNGQSPVFEFGSTIKSNKTTVPANGVLLSKLNPHIPRIWLPSTVGLNAVCSTEFLPFVPTKNTSTSLVYFLLAAPSFSAALCQLVTGTSNSHQRIKPDGVLSMQSAFPPTAVIAEFDVVASALLNRLKANREQVQTLSTLRDTLLPRLISGQLRLPEVPSSFEEVHA